MSVPQPKTETKWEEDYNGTRRPVTVTLPPKDPTSDIRCYVLVNSELPPIHAGIQGAHALAELVHNNQNVPILKDWVENHKTLVLLSANADQMKEMKAYFTNKNKKFASFLEPDLDNMETAIAFEPVNSLEGKVVFGRFKLFK